MFKKITTIVLLFSVLVSHATQRSVKSNVPQKAKYVFVLFGDGMSDNLVRLTELYLSAKYKKDTLVNFSRFPNVALTTTYSKTSQITCSAAAGTAIFCGTKTMYNGIGVNEQLEPVESIGTKLKKEGYKLGICSTNGIDHATPATIYAHTPDRKNFFSISAQLARSDVDFAAGAGFVNINNPNRKWDKNILTIPDSLKKYNWHLTTSVAEAKKSKAGKLILLNSLTEASEDMPLSIDRTPDQMNLKDFARIGIDRLYDPKGKGFFMLLEGGSIDHTMHSNDLASGVHEVINFIETIDIALDFYKKHPDETLLLVVSDHETGGLSLGKEGARNITAAPLMEQKMSYHKMEDLIQKMNPDPDSIIHFIDQQVFKLTESEIQYIKKASKQAIPEDQKALYARNNTFVAATMQIMQNRCKVGFSTRHHSAARIPLFSLGAGSELFHGVIENSDIPRLIFQAMGKTWPTPSR